MPSSPQPSMPAPRAPRRPAPLTSTPPSSATPTAASPSLPPTPPTPTPRPGSTFTSCSTSAPRSAPSVVIDPVPHQEPPVGSRDVTDAHTLYKTTVKVEVEEDVLVMDGVLVSDFDSGRPRSSVSEFGSTGSSLSSSLASNGGGNSLCKTEICWSWEESGFCRYDSKCQVGPLSLYRA